MTLAELGARDFLAGSTSCHFPVGAEPPPGDMDLQLFCGKPAMPGSRYCPGHHRICFPRRKRGKVATA